MAQVRQDNVQIKLEIDGSQSRTELDNLTRKALVLQEGMKGLKKGSEEYVAANKELSQVNARMAELRKEIGLTSLTIPQLGNLSRQLNRELGQLTPNTQSFIDKAKELAEVDARLAQVRREAKGVKEEIDNVGGGFADFFTKAVAFTGIQLGFQAILSGLKQLGSESIDEFAQAQGAAAQLEASLSSTGYAAGLTKQELLDLSTALEGKTILDGDAITQAQSVLLTFTKIKKGVYEEALPAIVDMATKLGGDGPADLKGATIQVGKALNDPVKGITALGKAGVSFSEDQKTMIKSLVETGDVAGAQAIILQELKTEFAGSAEAAAKAGTGPLKQFQVQIGNVKEGLGELIIDGLQALQPVLSAGIGLFAFFIELLKGTPAFINENKGVLLGLGVAILTLNAEQVILNSLVLAQTVIEKGRAAATLASATAQRLLNAAMTANPIGIIIAAVALLVGGFITLYDKSERVRETIAGLSATAQSVFASIKNIVVNQLGSVAALLAGIFTFNPLLIKKGLDELGPALKKAGTDAAGAYHAGYAEQEKKEQAAQAARESQQQAERTKKAQEAARKSAEEEVKASLESLKAREANIKAALALVAAGSAEELRLKKQEVVTKRDIELLDEKKTAGDKKVIRAEALRDLRQLQDEYDRKTKDAADKRAKEQADVEKKIADLKAGLLTDETERKILQLQAAAEKEKATAKGTAEQIAEQRKLIEQKLSADVTEERRRQAVKNAEEELDIEKRQNALIVDQYQRRAAELRTAAAGELLKVLDTDATAAEKRRLIQAKLQRDLVALEEERVAQQRAIAERIAAIDEDIALRRIARRRQQSADYSQERAAADADEFAVRKKQLDEQYAEEYFQKGLSEAEKLAISRRYLQEKDDLEEEYNLRSQERAKAGFELAASLASQSLQAIADFQKIDSDKQLAKAEKDKKARLLKLDQEYKAGTISKEQYEQQKSNIEANYDQKTRALKREAAQKEKENNIAQSIIAGLLAVVKALPDPFLATATGVAAGLATAKIIATPIPEFALGGVAGAPKPTWREKVRRFASGGINSVAGVPSVGQLHGGGGIRMVDGATGQHLGEWERGEPYMILSRDTYANNRELVDALLDTSLHRGGAPVRRRDAGYYAEGGTAGGALTGAAAAPGAGSQDVVQAINRVESAVRGLPSRQYIQWTDEDTVNVEDRLEAREADRQGAQIK
ncbi:hypothetical protein MUN81_15285 [Hymenobacter sp. 5317J-9]|uniref:hypothetical protein n=1 Tax=Hymenobacter sp. 5317J-9 TaxID=2932250 RepID=UPI001FD6AE88|nr:hypothetical protein [Hymenobacter sp. 5317J-9]UOQ96598.1 hypothetical protein MUN81_15285 [Hymenobacter sp. 5317J-9]